MPMPVVVPKDFRGLVVTLPANMGAEGITRLQQLSESAKLDEFAGHRVLHLHQVAQLDSSAVAALVGMVERVRRQGYEVALCEPPPIVRSYLDIYGANKMVEGAILSSDNDGLYESDLVPFVPPFVPEPRGRFDLYENGGAKSWLFGEHELVETTSPDLAKHPPKAAARAQVMAVPAGETVREVQAGAFVWVRRHMCGCSHTHTTFASIHRLHDWYRRKAFDFVSLELWASDQPAGIVTEKLAFRDRAHHGQFETLLKVDSSWQSLHANGHEHEDEFYYLYA